MLMYYVFLLKTALLMLIFIRIRICYSRVYIESLHKLYEHQELPNRIQLIDKMRLLGTNEPCAYSLFAIRISEYNT